MSIDECVGVFFFDRLTTRKKDPPHDVVGRKNAIVIVLETIVPALGSYRNVQSWRAIIAPNERSVEMIYEEHFRRDGKRL